MTPLRERDDLEFLIGELLERSALREGIHSKKLSAPEMHQLLRHSWPGNVRELEATLVRFLVAGDIVLNEEPLLEHGELCAAPDDLEDLNLQSHLARQTARQIQSALQAASHDKDQAAKLLGISRATLYRELRRSCLSKGA
jgi:transcriptional regulator with PAS, ATPase and Fis domain